MKSLCIVPCGKRKIWDKVPGAGPQEAKDVYIGPYASKCIQYAQLFYPKSWCILSAKFGFLFPSDIISETYNVTFKAKNTSPISTTELLTQVHEKGFYNYEKIVVLGGITYLKIVKYLFDRKQIWKPLNGLRLGEAIRKLNEAIITGVPLKMNV
ncbi:MAG: hypothetical protein IH591_01730 [Bacteroidales bacterium]|nr:hypothetical protein [Bacteroidales bacterium]